MTAFFCCWELSGQTKRSAPLEAVEVGTTGLLSPLLRRYTRLAAKIGKIDKNPYSNKSRRNALDAIRPRHKPRNRVTSVLAALPQRQGGC